MITDLEVRRAMNRLAAVYPNPKDPDGAFDEWRRVLRDSRLDLTESELEEAVTQFIAEVDKTYGYPVPGQIVTLVRARRTAPTYSEPPPTGPRATPEQVRAAWSKHVDLDELRRVHLARRAGR